jgi:hypothetical protein
MSSTALPPTAVFDTKEQMDHVEDGKTPAEIGRLREFDPALMRRATRKVW